MNDQGQTTNDEGVVHPRLGSFVAKLTSAFVVRHSSFS
jgi:hypothetical protein